MNKFKKKVIALAVIGALFGSIPAHAGIPVIDVASIAETIKNAAIQAKNFKDQMQEARGRLAELKHQVQGLKDIKDSTEGNYGDIFGDLLNNPTVSEMFALDDWRSIYNDLGAIEDLRDEFNMWSDQPETQQRFDSALKMYSFKQKSYEASVNRQSRIQKISNQMSLADNPAKKADLSNALAFEQSQQQNDSALVARLDELMKERDTLARQQKNAAQKSKLLEHSW